MSGNEFGTWGSALIAGKAAGLFDDLAYRAAEGALPDGELVRPNPANREIYTAMAARYIEMENALASLHHP